MYIQGKDNIWVSHYHGCELLGLDIKVMSEYKVELLMTWPVFLSGSMNVSCLRKSVSS